MMINTLMAIIAFLGGWMIRTMWQSIKENQKANQDLTEKVQRVEVLVAGDYVKKDDFERFISAIFSKLDKISDKIDSKADK